jgi:wyosine [tRNA(Phe)-imidazoG37] synthetase (radical SAM superfamily)
MINKGLTIMNNFVTCSCSCKYCSFGKTRNTEGIDYYRGKQIAQRFDEWRNEKGFMDFYLNIRLVTVLIIRK